ncbi:MAG: hypothetical protein HY231_12200 [Acidobacteria bacterium]|nr:hypothetical protein [Acidobacteriota bacterium]
MIFPRCFWQSFLVLMAISLCNASAQAQTNVTAGETAQRQADSHKDSPPPDDVEVLKLRVAQLQTIVDQQQRVLAAMEKRLQEVEGKTQTSALASAKPAPANEANTSATALPDNGISSAKTPASVADAAPDKTASPLETAEGKLLAGWKDHPFVKSADGRFIANLVGVAQLDLRAYQAGNHPPNTFLLRRARLGLEGTLAKYFDYRLLGDFADRSSALLRDAYVTVHRTERLQLRFGQFKAPFGQEENTPGNNLDFVERSLADNLAPSRSPGVMVFGLLYKGAVEYYVGAFNGKGLLNNNNNNTPESIVRVRFAPWKQAAASQWRGLAFGGAYAQGRNARGTSVSGQTESRSFTFYAPEIINGKVTRANGELSWTLGPAMLRAEYDQTNQEREDLGLGGTTLPGVIAKGLVGQFSYLLTGETKIENGSVTPRRELFTNEGGRRGYGAWELKARFARLQINDGTAKSNHAATLYFGVNWYLNRYVRYLFDVGLERFNDSLRSPKPGDRNYLVTLSRIQFAF